MTNEQAREVFNEIISNVTDQDRVADLELIREYMCNPAFRKAMEDYVWQCRV